MRTNVQYDFSTNEATYMKKNYTAVIKQRGQWWIGWIEEVPGVNCQETSRKELLESLKVTLREALEFNRREALEAAGDSFEEEPIAI
jgi:predicted RNase H-like HicB family nuclease